MVTLLVWLVLAGGAGRVRATAVRDARGEHVSARSVLPAVRAGEGERGVWRSGETERGRKREERRTEIKREKDIYFFIRRGRDRSRDREEREKARQKPE